MLKPSKYIYIPIKNRRWLSDSQGKPRMYKSVEAAVKNLKNHCYDYIHAYAIDDEVSREVFENSVGETDGR